MGQVTTAINSIGERIAPVDTIISIKAFRASDASLRISARDWLDWLHEVHRIRCTRHPDTCRAKSILMGLMNRVFTVQEFSDGVGVVDVAKALLIALRPWSREGSAIGSPAPVQLFLQTLSFLFRRLVGRSFHAAFRRSPLGQASFC